MAHPVIGAIELGFDELLGPAVFDPGCSVVSQFCHREILPGCEGLIFQGLIFQGLGFEGLGFSSLGLGCEFVIYLAPMYSDVSGSVDADPHLIAANLSDGNLVRMLFRMPFNRARRHAAATPDGYSANCPCLRFGRLCGT